MISSLPFLLAAPGVNEIFSVLVAIVFFVVWLVNQINDAKKQQRQKEQQAAGVPPRPAEPGANAGAPPNDPLRAQVDEFLRRAGKQPNAPPGASSPPAPRKAAPREEIVVLLNESAADPPRRPGVDRKRMPSGMPTAGDQRAPAKPPRRPQAAAPQRKANKPTPKSVAEHVAERIGASTQQFREEVANLGARVKQADEQFDRQLQQKFDHELGTLAGRTGAADRAAPAKEEAPPSTAAQIAAMMASPDGVRQAILLNEVLRRPTDRW